MHVSPFIPKAHWAGVGLAACMATSGALTSMAGTVALQSPCMESKNAFAHVVKVHAWNVDGIHPSTWFPSWSAGDAGSTSHGGTVIHAVKHACQQIRSWSVLHSQTACGRPALPSDTCELPKSNILTCISVKHAVSPSACTLPGACSPSPSELA